MTTRVCVLAAMVVWGCSAAAQASGPHQKKEGPSIKLHKENKHKDKEKHKSKNLDQRNGPVSVPDGDPSSALLLTVGVGTVGVVMALARLSERKSRQPSA